MLFRSCAVLLIVLMGCNGSSLGGTGLLDLFDVFFDLCAGQHDLAAAARAADLEIHAHPQHLEAGRSAGVLFAGEDGISNCDIHEQLSLLPAPSGTGPYRGQHRFRIGRRIQI